MNPVLSRGRLARFLIPSSLCYLSLPYVIFLAGWLRWYLALPCIGILALSLLICVREIDRIAGTEQVPPDGSALRTHHFVLLLLVALLLLGISGAGGYGHQDTDWLKHNAVLQDLIDRPWPVVYRLEGQAVPLVYYIAFYLPAALVGKLGGWPLANHALFAWSLAGLILAMSWFLLLNRRAGFTAIWLFAAFSGLDVIGQLLITPAAARVRPELEILLNWDHIEQWGWVWQYSSNVTLLFWVPNQALAGWIATAVLTFAISHPSHKTHSLFYCGLTPLWSPFVTAGLLPYMLTEFLLEDSTLAKRLRRYVSTPNLCGLVLLAVVGLFYAAKLGPVTPPSAVLIPHGFIWSFAPDTQAKVIGLALIWAFYLLEFGLYAFLIYSAKPDWDRKAGRLFVTTLVCLSLIPLYRCGSANDFVMRVSIPALFVLAVFLGRTLHSPSPSTVKRIILIALVVLGSATGLVEVRRHLTRIHAAGTLLQIPGPGQVTGLSLWDRSTPKSTEILLQYVGSSQAPFFELMAREDGR